MGTINQSQFNKSRLDKFLLVLSLPPILKDISNDYLGSRKKKMMDFHLKSISLFLLKIKLPTRPLPDNGIITEQIKI